MKKKLLKIFISCIAALIVSGLFVIGYYTYENKNNVTVTEYTVKTSKVDSEFSVIQLSDLHGNVIGENNEMLCDAVKNADPDLILMTGDMFSRSGDGYESLLFLIESLRDTAPLYYSFGNHEDDYFSENGNKKKEQMIEAFRESGATVLQHEYEDICVGGSNIRLGGFFGYAVNPDPDFYFYVHEKEYFVDLRFDQLWREGVDDSFLKKFRNTDRFTLLMCHIPDSYLLLDSFSLYPSDLILSGHLHGGQVILPLIGPVVAPNQGYFPEKTKGAFTDNVSNLIVSRGLGSGKPIPRVNNTPEVVLIKVVPQ